MVGVAARASADTFEPCPEDRRRPVAGRTLRRIFTLAAPQRLRVVGLLASLAVSSTVGLLLPLLTRSLIDDAIPRREFYAVALDVAAMIGTGVLMAVSNVYQGYAEAAMSEGLVRDLRSSLLGHLYRVPLSFFVATPAGEIVNRVSTDIDLLRNGLLGALIEVARNAAAVVLAFVMLAALDVRLCAVAAVFLAACAAPMYYATRSVRTSRVVVDSVRDRMQSYLHRTLSSSGALLLKSFGAEDNERQSFTALANELSASRRRLGAIGRNAAASLWAVLSAGPAAIWLVGSGDIFRGRLTVGSVVAALVYLSRLYGPTASLAAARLQIASALPVVRRIFEYFDLQAECDRPGALDVELAGGVRFEAVCFSYPDGRLGLEDVSFELSPGQVAAFIGPSGSGKTTVAHLLLRLYDEDTGSVFLDGCDVRELRLSSLRRQVGIVAQDVHLVHDSIAANLRCARPDATDDDLVAAATTAEIHDFVTSLPRGYDTVVGDRGLQLSAGQRQRVAIARVILQAPRIVILDEPTSALDGATEERVMKRLLATMRGRTIVIISHRLSAIAGADVIFEMRSGRLVAARYPAAGLVAGEASRAHAEQIECAFTERRAFYDNRGEGNAG